MKKKILNNFKIGLLIFLIIFLFFIFYFFIHQSRSPSVEPFYVFFKPFEQISNINRYNEIQYYMNSTDYQNYIENKYSRKPLILFSYTPTYDSVFVANFRDFFKQVVSNSNLLDLQLKISTVSNNDQKIVSIANNPVEKIIAKVNNNKYNLAICDSSELFYANSRNIYHPFDPKKNIRILSGLYYNYLFFVTKNHVGINQITDLRGKRVGIFYPSMTANYIIPQRIFQYYTGSNSNDKYVDYVYGNVEEHWQKLQRGEIDAFFFASFFPNKVLNTIFNQINGNRYTMIPIVFDDPQKFELENPYLERTTVNLHLVKQFMPKVVNGNFFNNFDYDFPTYKSKTFLICNKKMDTPTVYDLIRLLASQPIRPTNIVQYFTDIQILFINSSLLPIPYHEGVEMYLQEKGYVNRTDNEECAYFVGKEKCTSKVLRKNQLFAWDFLSNKDIVPRGHLPDVEEAWNLPSQTPFIK